MSDGTAIEWTDASWTPIRARNRVSEKIGWHCEHVSEGCRNCYAERWNRSAGTNLFYKPAHINEIEIYLDEEMLRAPLRWKKPRKIFPCSMTDLFADFVPESVIDRMFAVMSIAKQHTFQVLTKRPARMRAYCASECIDRRIGAMATAVGTNNRISYEYAHELRHSTGVWPLPNVWLGVSAEDQANANARIPQLLETVAAKRFVSLEPLIDAIDLQNIRDPGHFPGCLRKDALLGRAYHEDDDDHWTTINRLDWVIVSGESGRHARPMYPQWPRWLRDQCASANVPFFFKQWGEWRPVTPWSDNCERVGKTAAGRRLEGVEHNAMPV